MASVTDMAAMTEACAGADAVIHLRVAFGVSANTRGGWVSLDEARALGYEPRDACGRSASAPCTPAPEAAHCGLLQETGLPFPPAKSDQA